MQSGGSCSSSDQSTATNQRGDTAFAVDKEDVSDAMDEEVDLLIEEEDLELLVHLEDPVLVNLPAVLPRGVALGSSAEEIGQHLQGVAAANPGLPRSGYKMKNRRKGLKYKKRSKKQSNKDTSETCSTKKAHRKHDSDGDGQGGNHGGQMVYV